MELLIALFVVIAGIIWAVWLFAYPEVFQRPPWGRVLAYFLGYGVLPLLLVLLLIYGQADPTPFAIALAAVGLLWLVFSVP
jgi:hypothetical protein